MKRIALIAALLFTLGASAQDYKLENNRLVLPKPVSFLTGSAELTTEGKAQLEIVAAFLKAKEYVTLLRIEGHVSGAGTGDKNQSLSEQRALTVANYLITAGIDCKRLLPVGFGQSKPIAANTTPEGRAQNNRIEFQVAELNHRAIGGMPVDGGGKVAGNVCN